MKRVFHIISRFDVGGAESVAINIAMSKNPDIEQHIVELQRGHSGYTSEIIQNLKNKGVRYHRSWMPIYFHLHCYIDRLISILFPLRFLFLWVRYKPEIVHTHTEMPDMALWLTLRMFPFIKVKVVRTIHNTVLWSGMEKIGPRVERFMQSRKANVAISKNVQVAYVEKYGGELPPIIYNGVSPVPQQQYSKVVPGKINVCFAGRFEEQKGIDVLCAIIKSLEDDDRYYFHVFGSGREQSLIDELKGQQNVSVNAPVNGIASYMSSFDYMIMPSRHEGLSILALEGSFNGLPLMINSCAGLEDTLPESWPLRVKDNEIGEWIRLFEEELPLVDREKLKHQSYEFVVQQFSMEKMQGGYNEIYRI